MSHSQSDAALANVRRQHDVSCSIGDMVCHCVFGLKDGSSLGHEHNLIPKSDETEGCVWLVTCDTPIYWDSRYFVTSIRYVFVPDSVREIKAGTFYKCWTLSVVVFGPHSSLERICCDAFCRSGLTKIWIPDSVREIGDRCFLSSDIVDVMFGLSPSLELIGYDAFSYTKINEFFLPGSSLFTEARLFLMSEYRAVSSYESVLMQLAAGVVEVSKIRDKTGLSDANISQMLISLEGQEIVERKKKVVDRGVAKGWRISDGYFLFYYKYVFPYFSLIERGHGNGAAMKAISSLDSFVGKAMEKYFIEYVLSHSELLITEIGSIDFPNPTKRGNEEVDLIGRYDGGFILGECKWQNDKTGLSVFLILQERSRMLFPQGAEIKYYILSRCGFTDELEMEGSKRNDLTLIPGEDLFGMKNTPL